MKLSGPNRSNILFKYASDAPDDIGLISAIGSISIGIFIILIIGFNSLNNNSKKPLFINMLIANIIDRNVGNNVLIILKLLTTPVLNESYISIFFL